MECNRCGKSMTRADGSSLVGISLQVLAKDAPEDFIQAQFGKYEIGRTYSFCWECWLDSLMGVKS